MVFTEVDSKQKCHFLFYSHKIRKDQEVSSINLESAVHNILSPVCKVEKSLGHVSSFPCENVQRYKTFDSIISGVNTRAKAK